MKSEWEYMAIDDLFELHEQMQDVLSAKLKAKKVELERRLRQLNRQSKLMVGVRRFELPTSRSRTVRSSLAELHPGDSAAPEIIPRIGR